MSEVKPFELPTAPVPALHKSPKNLIIFSKPKVGKTTLLAQLPNALLIDLEQGSDFISAMKVQANSVGDISQIGNAILAAGKPYDYIVLDTITALEEMCIPYAEQLYSQTSMGKNWFTKGKLEYGNFLNLANGAAYPYLRQAFDKIIEYVKTLAPRVILLGHIKDTKLEKNGAEFDSLDLDLTGKIRRITAAKSDAIGYLYRKGNQNILSFKTSDEIACGARPEHLRNKEIVISEIAPDGTVTTHWDQIFID